MASVVSSVLGGQLSGSLCDIKSCDSCVDNFRAVGVHCITGFRMVGWIAVVRLCRRSVLDRVRGSDLGKLEGL